MKELFKDAVLAGVAFGAGYIYSEIKAGREFNWESPNGIIKIHIPVENSEPEVTELED